MEKKLTEKRLAEQESPVLVLMQNEPLVDPRVWLSHAPEARVRS